MTRRELMALTAAFGAQSKLQALSYRDYSRCLPDFLRGLAQAAYEKRNRELAKLTSPAAILERQRWVTRTLWKLAGGQPERTPLNARTLASFMRPGYRLEKLVYESSPGFVIPANLYLPTLGRPPYPGVLFQMGHSLNGKANDTYQKCCQGLARLGYVVLAFDPMGQGERTYYPGPNGLTRFGSADTEHTYPGKQLLLTGNTATGLQLWDAVRSLDYLAQRPEVDPKRLASTGQSGGATLTMLLAAVDPRLAAAVVSSGNTENFACANFDPPGSTDDAEQDLIGSGPLGFDRWDLLYPLAPKPLLLLVSAKDFFGTYSPRYLASGREEYRKLQRIYSVLGHQDRLAWGETPLPHGLSYDLRLQIYRWFERWLKHSDRMIEHEPDVSPEPDQRLWAGPTGNTVRDFGSKTPFHFVLQREAALKSSGQIPMAPAPGAPSFSVLAKVPSGALSIEAVEVASAPHVWLPVWCVRPKATERTVLLLDERGRNQHWREGGLAEQLAARGTLVYVADLRGIGDLKPEPSRGAPGYSISHADEEEYAWASLILGVPLLTQRVTDILALVRAAAPSGKLLVAASGRLTVPALFAAALDQRIQSLYLSGGIVSLRNVARSENYHCPLANILPNLLAFTDLPDLAARIAPRRIRLAGGIGPDPQKAYRSPNVEVIGSPEWTADRLLELA